MQMEIGTRVKIEGISDEDVDLNGLTGTLSRKFFTMDSPHPIFGDIGVWLDEIPKGDKCRAVNVLWSEVVPIDGMASHNGGK